MSKAISKWLQEKDKIVAPKTLAESVFNENGGSLKDVPYLVTEDDEEVEIDELPSGDNYHIITTDLDYSEEEQLTGKRWVNGKPVYKRTFVLDSLAKGDDKTITNLTEAEEVIDVQVFGYYTDNRLSLVSPSWQFYKSNNGRVAINVDWSYNFGKTYAIVEYTKTKDTSDSPVVVPSVDIAPFRFGITEDGEYGYYKAGADTVTPFKSGGNIDFKTIGNLDESSVSFEVPKDKLYLCVLKYGYTPDYHFFSIIPSVGNYGGRFVVSNDYKTIMYNFGGYTLSNLNTARDELENTIKFTLTKSAKYTFGEVELMYFPIDGSPITPSEESSIYDVINMFEFISQGSVNVIFGEDKIRTRWNGSISSIGAIAYSTTRIDLSKYNSISIKFRATEHISDEIFVHLLLSNTKDMIDPRSGAYREVRSNALNEEVTLTLDVSDISGEYYIGLAPTGTTCEMYDLKFE